MKYLIVLIFAFSSCATKYKNINLQSQSYSNTEISEELIYSYKYDVLRSAGNKKYGKKEDKYDFKIVGVKIENLTNQEIDVGKDLEFKVGDRIIHPLETKSITDKIKQPVYTHLLYGLIWVDFKPGSVDDLVLPVGAPIAAYNVITASKANSNFKNEFREYSLIDKTILPKETIFGFISYRDAEIGKLIITRK